MRKLLTLISFFTAGSFLFNAQAQNTWLVKAPFGGGPRDNATGFAIGNTGYILSGTDTGGYFMDMWAWSSNSNTWTDVAPYPGGLRLGLRSVSLNGYGYAIGGEHPSNCFLMGALPGGGVCAGTFYSDVWKYDPTNNTWASDTGFPGSPRNYAVAVADPNDSTIYYGTGNDNGAAYLSDWWAFYTPTHTWTQLADFPGGQRDNAIGFFANGNIYVGTGDNNDSVNYATNDLWKYTPSTNTWVRVTNIPGVLLRCASAFSIGNFGYVCLGVNNSSYLSGGWRYNALTDYWQPITNYGGGPMCDGVAFTIDSNGYVGTGVYGNNACSQFWEYTFDNSSALGVAATVKSTAISIYPNPAGNTVNISYSGINSLPATFTLLDILGNTVSTSVLSNPTGQATLNVSGLSNGIYLYEITGSDKILKTGKLIIAR